MVHLVVGVVGLAVYVYNARKYKLRERDEPCHVRHFVEEYYSKIPTRGALQFMITFECASLLNLFCHL